MFLLSGPPGSGKTTQSKMLADNCQFRWLAVGRLLAAKYPKGSSVRKDIDAGRMANNQLVDELVYGFLNQHLSSAQGRLVVDGYPRTIEQATAFLEKYQDQIRGYWRLELDQETSIARLQARQRPDDDIEKARYRWDLYRDIIPQVVEIVRGYNIRVVSFKADQPVESLHQQLLEEFHDHQ